MDFIVQKSTELGVRRIIPLITERSQIRHTGKIDRWRKIALSASQQSGRDKIPEIDKPISFRNFIKNQIDKIIPPFSKRRQAAITGGKEKSTLSPPWEKGGEGGFLNIIFSEEHKDRNLKKVLTSFKEIKNITLLIGPEGGFSKDEVTTAVERGFIETSLGPRILRTETAPITAISIIQYELGDVE
jgi:16S rRNA (uracil1498-N3)-methyltransferase